MSKIDTAIYKSVFEQYRDALIIIDLSGKIIEVNEFFKQIFEIDSLPIINESYYSLMHEYLPQEAKTQTTPEALKISTDNTLKRLIETKEPIKSEFLINVNGSSKNIYSVSFLIETQEESYVAVIMREDRSNKLLRINLDYRLKFEALLSDVSSRLINIEPKQLAETIKDALKKLCEFTNSAGALLYTHSKQTTKPVFWWLENIADFDDTKISKKYSNIHNLMFKLSITEKYKTKNIFIATDDLPDYAKKYMKMLALNNLIVLPVVFNNTTVGSLVILNSMPDNNWQNEDINLIRTLSDVMISAIDRIERHVELQRELKLNEILAEVSNYIISDNSLNTIARYIFYKAIELSNSRSGFICHFDDSGKQAIVSSYCMESSGKPVFRDKIIYSDDVQKFLKDKNIDIYDNYISEAICIPIDNHNIETSNYISAAANIFSKHVGHIFVADKSTKYDDIDRQALQKLSYLLAIAINRTEIQNDLLQSEERFRSLIENASDGIYLIRNNEITYANPKYCEITGYTYEEIIADDFDYNILLNDDGKLLVEKIISDRIKGNDDINNFQIQLVAKDGKVIDIEITEVDIQDSNASSSYMGIVKDISSRKQYEEMIVRQNQILETISYAAEKFLKKPNWQENMYDILERLRNITSSSAVFLYQNIIGKDDYNTICKYYTFDNDIRDDSETEMLATFNLREIGLSGWADMLEKRQILVIDSEDMPQKEQEFISPDMFRSITLIPIFIAGSFWGFLLLQNNLEKQVWLQNELDTFNTLAEILAAALLREQNETQLSRMNADLENRVRSRTIQLENALAELQDEISIRKNVENELIKAKNDITLAYQKEKELGELKSKFIAMVSHEYRTPLTVVLSSTFLLERAISKNEQSSIAKHLDKIRIAVKQMTQLLENVLMSGRIETDSYEMSVKSFDIVKHIENLIDEVKTIDKFNHPFEFIDNIDDAMVAGDQTIINLILTNLLVNATKYSPNGAPITINLARDESQLKIKIKDRGFGISEKDKKYIFSPFYRGDANESTSGTGLGLSLVKRSLDMLNGSITFDSKIGEGTEFCVLIPVSFIKSNKIDNQTEISENI